MSTENPESVIQAKDGTQVQMVQSLDVYEKPISIASIKSKIVPDKPLPPLPPLQMRQTSVSFVSHWFKRYCLIHAHKSYQS
jgi:hypothetical protein